MVRSVRDTASTGAGAVQFVAGTQRRWRTSAISGPRRLASLRALIHPTSVAVSRAVQPAILNSWRLRLSCVLARFEPLCAFSVVSSFSFALHMRIR